jgi:hypothetical protein
MGIFCEFLSTGYTLYSTLVYLPLSDSTVAENAGIKPRTVATVALAVKTF